MEVTVLRAFKCPGGSSLVVGSPRVLSGTPRSLPGSPGVVARTG